MKRRISILLVVLFVLVLFLISCDSSLKQYDEVAGFVIENREAIEKIPFNELQSDSEKGEKILKEYFNDDPFVESVYPFSSEVIVFYCGSSGNAQHTEYTGFYYSKNDSPFGLEFEGEPPIEIQPGVFEYNKSTDAHYVWTKRICDNMFYFYQKYY